MERSPISSACQHALLARSPVGHVSMCPECGIVHVSLNCVSVRLEVTAFLALAEMLSKAQKRLHSAEPQESHCGNGQAPVVH
ncbi:hypothetical protein B9N43_00510 [Denitratisoma sp. DHT3]|uniref:hypothetical protein n=1 Tax=Denitratisoma sp. DHT3 TaxID=1981880 RepID=UPI0011987615|nr:hypothetical protein [Denitratisoma sp. DHT3]QDX79877.1 hypothetical protein B9N43_00510 [Denitratisoma sp. DHT3]